MFLNEKGLLKALLVTAEYFVLGCFCIVCNFILSWLGAFSTFLLVLGIVVILLCPLIFLYGRYVEGKAIHINKANKLVRKQLKPAEFLKYYNSLKNNDSLIINKPSFEILYFVYCANDVLNGSISNDTVVDEMIEAANDKKKNFAQLIKVSHLYSCGRIEQADSLLYEIQKQKLDTRCNLLIDGILKVDRAKVMRDYRIAEVYLLNALNRSFPKPDNLSKLIYNYSLGEVYEGLNDTKKAIQYFEYCSKFGGETAIKSVSAEKVKSLTQ